MGPGKSDRLVFLQYSTLRRTKLFNKTNSDLTKRHHLMVTERNWHTGRPNLGLLMPKTAFLGLIERENKLRSSPFPHSSR